MKLKVKRKLTKLDFTPIPTPVWRKNELGLEPSAFFLKWWQDVSVLRFGDKEHCLEVAAELGYLWQYSESNSDEVQYDPMNFDYDPILYRKSLDIPDDMPIISFGGDAKRFQPLWNRLMKENSDG